MCTLLGGLCACRGEDKALPDSASHEGEGGGGDWASDTAPSDSLPDLALIADSSHGRYLHVRLDDATIVHELRLDVLHPTLCTAEVCAAFVAWPSVSADGYDELTLTFAPNTEGESASGIVERVRIGADEDTVLWQLDTLDFVTHFAHRPDLCAQDDPCEVPEVTDESVRRNCRLTLTHEVKVVEEDEDAVSMWIADTQGPTRVLKVRLDKTSSCGVVEDVLSEGTAVSWAGYDAINDVDVVDLGDGRETLLVSSLSQNGGPGLASASLWQKNEGAWVRLWQHPDEATGGYLAAAHNPDWVVDDDGQSYLVYAHSNGMGTHPLVSNFNGEDDHMGSIGVARVTASGADYLFDATLPEEGEFGFLRDVNRQSDGTFLVTDSGCMRHTDTDCTRPAQLWHVELPELSEVASAGSSGAFSATRANMNVVVATPIETRFSQPLRCGLFTPYTAQLLPGESLGRTLRALLRTPGEACPAE